MYSIVALHFNLGPIWLPRLEQACLTLFRTAARGLHVPAGLTREPTEDEARKRRASVRPRVGCCEELAVMCQDVVP